MKIAVIGTKGIPPKQGGIEHYCAEMYPRMLAQGHSVHLYARSSYTELRAFETYDFQGVQVTSLPCPGRRGADALITSALGALIASKGKYDVLHFHALGPALFTCIPKAAVWAGISSTKIVVTCHGLDWQRNKWGKKSSHLILHGEKAAVKFADEIVVVNQELQSYFKSSYAKETIFVPNAPATYANSDPSFTHVTSLGLTPKKYILFLGRLVPEKCPDLLIKAFQTIEKNGWKLVLVGGSSDAASFSSSLAEMASGDPNVLFTGEMSGSHLAEMVRGAGLFVLPSNVEGMSLALLEAMQEGIPVLASDIPANHEFLNHGRGLLFKVGSLQDLCDRLSWAIHHPVEMASMAAESKAYILSNYSWERSAKTMLHIFEGLSTKAPHSISDRSSGAFMSR